MPYSLLDRTGRHACKSIRLAFTFWPSFRDDRRFSSHIPQRASDGHAVVQVELLDADIFIA